MGIYSSMAKIIVSQKTNYNYKGEVATLGVQHLNYDLQEVNEIFSSTKVEPDKSKPAILNSRIKNNWIKPNALDAKTLFHMMGFDNVEEIDVNGYENASIIHDMNNPVSDELHNKFDMVFDGGTIEHVFNIKEAIFNISRMLKLGGTIIHVQPLSGWINHGFFQLCPTFLSDYYSANGYTDIKSFVLQVNRIHGAKVKYWEVDDLSSENFLFNDFYCKTLHIFFAKKTQEKELTIPVQGFYRKIFSKEKSTFANDEQNKMLARCEPRINRLSPKGKIWKWMYKLAPIEAFSKIHSFAIEKNFNNTNKIEYFDKI